MEKIKYGGTIFELVPGGFDAFSEGRLTIMHQKGGKTLEQIKAIAKAVTATDSIDLLDDSGEMIRSLDGYIYAGDIREIEDYLIEVQQVPVSDAVTLTDGDTTAGGNAEGEQTQIPEYVTQEVRADVAVVVFKLPDVRTELAQVKAVQEEMLVSMLEGGM